VRGVAVVENSKWDSEHFDLGVGKLKLAFFNRGVGSDGRSRLFRSVKSTAFSRGLDVVFARVDLDDMLTIHSLESEGAILTDVLLSFRTDLKRDPISSGLCPKVQVVQASLDDEEVLVGIAKDVFKSNHFHADPRLPRDKCDEVYAKWVSGCLRGLADVVLVAKKRGKHLGFISCKVEGAGEDFSRGIIDLIGVKKRFEGRGIGSCLVAEALKWFSSRSKSVYVGTQAANISAVRLYEKMGFRLVLSEATLHLWTRSA
jgi:ribosomal protein S18 acetylase RimI-like enzyme